ncbi:ectoine utilization protein EutA [Paracoccus liaowanqingii]|uniref:Ectoine utilization protein EutA n=1 Tax=Paracoccus liaowanqingii TaxID=2560053 RepID=A0A4V1BIY2_9RHOB|nr:aspartate/glutamate racemase family protein [Paracoccus liaowanqingii]QBX34382.1 ectoine utilization protein EutA [Paracoccus liaowanqingii]
MRRDSLTRFGLVTLATDLTIEGDAAVLMPRDTQLHVTRIAFDNPTTEENLRLTGPRLRAAVDLLVPGITLAGIGFGCTSASAVLGDQIEGLAGGRAPVTTPAGAALRGFAALGLDRVALMTPYLAATTDLVGDHFQAHGVQVLRRSSMGHADDRDMAMLRDAEIIEMAEESDHPDAQALFMSCTALPALGLIDDLEARLGKPVLTSNQVLFWAMLDIAAIPAAGPGALFRARTW